MYSHFQQFATTVSQSLPGSLLSFGLLLTKQDRDSALLLRPQRK